MPTDFASVHAHLENAQAALRGSDPQTQRLREVIGSLIDDVLKAQYSPVAQGDRVVAFPGAEKSEQTPSSRHG
ncbi:hypothetical protein [Nitratireductor indicus]|uniref:Uncharacterized protein n=1 Tax=Nitratireductor indicus C115 TaxID=1231190 RepID=K2NZD6_9HYPH|nr:hypothetical protein [Nitratireductor indicus]EKF44575.1 hypothetical protein NA8A_02495 [Nitratireductor indicus C115]MDS1137527.1 hypothetical protein [Nitratireductor indicus]SFQ31535.1 hypothetical protein SAMN05216176_102503 [Nitratireductor indicus]